MWRIRRARVAGGAYCAWRLLWLALWLAPPASAAAVDNFCDLKSNLKPDTGVLEWKRRVNEIESTRSGTNLRLRCCARNHDVILWYRLNTNTGERVPLPSPHNSSLVELLDNNRTLQTTSAQERDRGRYVCEVHNKTAGATIHKLFEVIIKVDKPLIKNTVLQDTHEVRIQRIGDKIKIDCSMFTENASVVWKRDDIVNKTFPDFSKDGKKLSNVRVVPFERLNVTSEIKEANKVKGVSIIIDPIQSENFGRYYCYNRTDNIIRTVILKDGGSQKALKIALICSLTLFIMLAIILPFCWHWRVEILLFWKDRFGKLEENDEKLYDIFVSYDSIDAPFVLGILMPVLEEHFRYRCFAWERDSLAGDCIPETVSQSVRDSRRFLMILSPALLENRWCTFALHIALKEVLELRLHIICVKLQDVDWSQVDKWSQADKSANETIRQVLHVVRTVEWEPSKEKSMALRNQQFMRDKSILNFKQTLRKKEDIPEDDIKAPGRSRFWRKLRLYLPPRRTLPLLTKPPSSPTSTKSLLSLPQGPDCC